MHMCMIDVHMSIYIYACVHMYTYEHLYSVLRLCVVPSTLRIMVKDVFNPMLLLSGEVEVHLIFSLMNQAGFQGACTSVNACRCLMCVKFNI